MPSPLSSPSPRKRFLARGATGGAAMLLGGGALATAAGRVLAVRQQAGAAGLQAADPFADYPAHNPALNGEQATLRVWLTPDLAAQPAYRTAIGLFERMYPRISVELTPVVKDDIPARYKIAVASGGNAVVPDLVSHHAYLFGAQGLAQECDYLWAAWGQKDSFLPAALDDVTWRLNTFGIPMVGNAVLTILNADMFAHAHVPLPTARTTFAQFTSAVTAVQRSNGSRYAMLLSADPATVTAVVHANGGVLLRTEPISGRNLQQLTDPRVVDAVRFYTELGWRQRLAPLPPQGATNRLYLAQLFAARQAPAFFGTLGDLALISSANSGPRLAVAPLPGGTTGRTSGSVNDGASLVVTADPLLTGRHPHAAFELGKWLVARPPALAVAQSLRLAPTVAGYYGDPIFRHDAITATYFDVARVATSIGLDAYPEAFDHYRDALRASFGGQDAGRQLASVAGAVQAAMDRADAGIDSDH